MSRGWRKKLEDIAAAAAFAMAGDHKTARELVRPRKEKAAELGRRRRRAARAEVRHRAERP